MKRYTYLLVILLVDLLVSMSHANERLIGGTVTDLKDWPANLIMRTTSWCSATMIGPRVGLTAAHCVGNGATASFGGIPAKCYQHPSYKANYTADYALCVLAQDYPAEKYETVNSDPTELKAQEKLLLTGFGCHVSWTTPSDRQFRTGNAVIRTVPSPSSHYVITRGTVVVCAGDSGSSVYIERSGHRKVAGVVSRSDYGKSTSYLSSVSSPVFRSWAASFVEQHAVGICGISPIINCR